MKEALEKLDNLEAIKALDPSNFFNVLAGLHE
jgi:hypothetical protein